MDREADPISDHRTRRYARLTSLDVRARRLALRSVQPSPARQEAPEPDAWLPIDLTAELALLDLSGELELLEIEEGQVDLDRELVRARGRLLAHRRARAPVPHRRAPGGTGRAGLVPAGYRRAGGARPGVDRRDAGTDLDLRPHRRAADDGGPRGRHPVEAGPVDAHVEIEADADAAPAALPLPVPEEYAQLRPNRPAIAHHRRAVRLRRRLIVTALVVACSAALVGVIAQVHRRDRIRVVT